MSRLHVRLAEVQLAVMLLTRLPAGRMAVAPAIGAATWAFPLVGALIGGVSAAVLCAVGTIVVVNLTKNSSDGTSTLSYRATAVSSGEISATVSGSARPCRRSGGRPGRHRAQRERRRSGARSVASVPVRQGAARCVASVRPR